MRYEKFIVLFIVCMVFIPILAFTQTGDITQNTQTATFSGTLRNGDEIIEFATVVILELELDNISDEYGTFSFEDLPEGAYTLLVIAEGFEDKEFPINVSSPTTTQSFQMADSVSEDLFVENIIITAERLKNSDSGKKTLTREDVDRIPLQNDDPISAFTQDTGVLSVNRPRRGEPLNFFSRGQIYSIAREYSVYGGETGWNRYFYGNIQIPTNLHTGNPNASIITRDAVESIDIYKGVAPTGAFGPGLGGTISLVPRRATENYLMLGISPTDPSATFSYAITENLTMFIHARYAISKYTILPLLNLYAESDPDFSLTFDDYSYADAIFSLEYKKGNHDIRLVNLGFYDNTVGDGAVNIPASGDNPARTVNAGIENFPIYGASGLTWSLLLGDSFKNKVSTYFSIFNSSADTSVLIRGADYLNSFGYTGYTRTIDYTILDHFDWFLSDNTTLTLGAEFKYLNLVGKHEDHFELIDVDTAVNLSDTTATYNVEEQIYRIYGFTELAWNIGNVETVSTLGATQVITSDGIISLGQLYPSAREQVNYNINNDWKLSIAASVAPAFLEGSKYIDRLISEEISEYNNSTKYTKPTYGIATLPKLTWQITNVHSVFTEPFFAYYYNFSGFHNGIVINNDRSQQRGFLYLTPTQGVSTGMSVGWNWDPQYHNIEIAYTYGYAMYDTERYGWLPPNNDYRHQLKFSYTYSQIVQFQLGISGNVLIDSPFTPRRVIENTSGSGDALIQENDYPMSARSYIPSYELYLNLRGTIVNRPTWTFNYRFQPGNLLGMFELRGDEVKDEYVGASSKDFDNRTFEFRFQPITLLQDLFLSFDLTIKL